MRAIARPSFPALAAVDRRTILGIALAALAAALVLAATRPAPTVPVLVAAADLPAGVPLGADDVSVRHLPDARGLVGGDTIGELEGWVLTAPIGAGEPLLPSQLRPPERLHFPAELALRLPSEQAVFGRLAPSDRIDIYVTWPAPPGERPLTELLVDGVVVVDVSVSTSAVGGDEVDLVLAVDDDLAAAITSAQRTGTIDVVKVAP